MRVLATFLLFWRLSIFYSQIASSVNKNARVLHVYSVGESYTFSTTNMPVSSSLPTTTGTLMLTLF
jgi:hypothetical protein